MSGKEVVEIVAVLREAMEAAGGRNNFDLTIDGERGTVDLATDDWTIELDPAESGSIAFVSIDQEPDDPGSFAAAIRATFSDKEIAALNRADATLEGEISAALTRSGDPLSEYLASLLSRES